MLETTKPKMRSIPEASKELDMPAYTLRRLCKEGNLPHVRSGNRILVNVTLIIDILNNANTFTKSNKE